MTLARDIARILNLESFHRTTHVEFGQRLHGITHPDVSDFHFGHLWRRPSGHRNKMNNIKFVAYIVVQI
jgi:hypothetical protein